MAKILLLAATDPNITYLLQRYAEESGLGVVHAGTVEDALALAQQARPAAIILEIGSPGMMDWEALRGLRAEETTRSVPVVVYSWSDEATNHQPEGVVGYLTDPVLYEDFVAALENAGVLSRRSLQNRNMVSESRGDVD